MQIVVNKKKFQEEIQFAYGEYQETQRKAMSVFAAKIQKYAEYVAWCVGKNKNIDKPCPNMPYDQSQIFTNALDALKAHTQDSVKLNDNEYHSILNGMNQAITMSAGSLTALSALEY